MANLLLLRKKLNLSLDDLAEYLGNSRAQVSRIERGIRTLNGPEQYFAANLQILLMNKENDPKSATYSNKDESAQLRAEIKYRIDELELQLANRKQELKKMLASYRQVCEALPYYKHIEANLRFLDQTHRQWLKSNREYQEKLLLNNGLLAQHKLKSRIKVVTEELKFHRTALKKRVV
jgi:transcriptional regulator with XRE-family HTH domain